MLEQDIIKPEPSDDDVDTIDSGDSLEAGFQK